MTKNLLRSFVFTLCCFLCFEQHIFSQLTCSGNALSFNGNGQYLKLAPNQFADTNFLANLDSDYTIECLIKWRGGADFQRIFDFSYGNNFFMFLTTSENNNHVPRFAISTTGLGAPQVVDATVPLTTGVYHHIAVTYSKANSLVNIFIDGANVGSGTVNIDADSVYHGDDAHDSSANYIGLSSFQNDPQLNADIDEFRISDTVRYTGNFTPVVPFGVDGYTVLLHHFDEPSSQYALDVSGNNYTGQLGSTPDADDNDPTHVSCLGVLATSLINFTATNEVNKIALNWQTASETNTAFYEVQKSPDGRQFTDLAKVTAHGTTAASKYSFADASPFSGNNYYRLKQVDKNGSVTLSNVVFVLFNKNSSFKIYPTITSDKIHIYSSATSSTLIIYNMVGKPLKAINMNSAQQDVSVSNLSAGTYIIRSKDGSVVKFVKQ